MTDETPQQEVLIVTGMSGAGRSTVGNALEDLGWYVVDNLPPRMLRPLIDVATKAGETLPKIAVVTDVRGGRMFNELDEALEDLRATTDLRVLFLEATDDVLVRRFEQVRRPHPLQGDGTILDGITQERSLMLSAREKSDIIIDTSNRNIHQLATKIQETFADSDTPGVQLSVVSFGFKYGVPTDADHVIDLRFLPNPFWIPELRPFTGRDRQVEEFVFDQPGAEEFFTRYVSALEPVLAGYQRENKRHATIAVGCTGGKHRSVAFAERLGKNLSKLPGVASSVSHRDLGRE